MKKLIHAWKSGIIGLLTNKTISFYTFFTIILVECIYLWTFYNVFVAFPATIFLLGYIANVIIFAWLKTYYEDGIEELIMSFLYIITYISLCILLFIIGKLFYFDGGVILTIIPFVVTGLSITVRKIQKIFYKFNFICTLLQLIVIGGPIIAFIVMIIRIPIIPFLLKIIISNLYIFCIPFIAYQEVLANCNIFEIAFNRKWLKRKYRVKKFKTLKFKLLKD